MKATKSDIRENPAKHFSGAQRAEMQNGTLTVRAWRAVDALVDRGIYTYRRDRDIPRLLPMLPSEITAAGVRSQHVIGKLKRALRQERALGRAGHWGYNIGRHLALTQALKAEIQISSIRTSSSAGAFKQKRRPEGGVS